MNPTIAISPTVKGQLEDIRDKEEHSSLDSVIRTLLMERKMYKMAVNAIK